MKLFQPRYLLVSVIVFAVTSLPTGKSRTELNSQVSIAPGEVAVDHQIMCILSLMIGGQTPSCSLEALYYMYTASAQW